MKSFARIAYITTLTLVSFIIKAQSTIDSLKKELANAKHDSSKVKICNQLFNNLRESDSKEAISYGKQGLLLAEKLKDKKSISRLAHNLGTLFYLKAEYPVALGYYLKALDIREELKDSVNMAKSFNNIGILYYEEGNLKEALEFHNKSIIIKEKLNDQLGLASSYGNIGNVYFKLAKQGSSDSIFTKSLNCHVKAQYIQEQIAKADSANIHNLIGLSATYNNMGNIMFEKSMLTHNKDFLSRAVDYHFQALEIQLKIDDTRGISHSYINIAGIKDRLGKTEEAIRDYELALKYATSADMREAEKSCYEGLSNTYERAGDYKNGLKYFKLFNDIKDSILDIAKSEQLTEMQTKYEADKQAKAIELLNKNKSLAENEAKRQKLLINTIIIVLILVVTLIVILYNRYRFKSKSEKKLQDQNDIIGLKNKEITDSIKYAKRIQEAILPPAAYIQTLLPHHFIYYRPKDIVSGDFYWLDAIGDKIYVAAVDCTGHGVPGAFISIVGFNLLKHAIHEHGKTKPSEILDQVNNDLSASLRQSFTESNVKDGMDLSLCCIDLKNMCIEYAGANNAIYIISQDLDEITDPKKLFKEIKADKQPIGTFESQYLKPFTNNVIPIKKGDTIYMFTDGYADQFGGPLGKKFKYKQFEELLLEIHKTPTDAQKDLLARTHENWRGVNEQVDDILVVGIRI
ncbi:MAG: tetratricopeptide repeat protein [Bacteroidota bacterium]|nr:tetratricopeptide repeat protein [Bacteroidota bacterium]